MTNDKTLYTQPVSTADKPPIQVVDLHKSFGSNEVLKGIDLEVENGEVIAVM